MRLFAAVFLVSLISGCASFGDRVVYNSVKIVNQGDDIHSLLISYAGRSLPYGSRENRAYRHGARYTVMFDSKVPDVVRVSWQVRDDGQIHEHLAHVPLAELANGVGYDDFIVVEFRVAGPRLEVVVARDVREIRAATPVFVGDFRLRPD